MPYSGAPSPEMPAFSGMTDILLLALDNLQAEADLLLAAQPCHSHDPKGGRRLSPGPSPDLTQGATLKAGPPAAQGWRIAVVCDQRRPIAAPDIYAPAPSTAIAHGP